MQVVKTATPPPAPLSCRMIITAHPDDSEFTVAGTAARWVQEGRHVVYVLCTDGSRGSNQPDMPPEKMAPIRRKEQLAAARVLGVQTVILLNHEDGTLEPSLELRRELTALIRRFRPDIVACTDPTRYFNRNVYVNHPDHRAAGEAALYAVFPSACTRFIFRELLDEGLEPHKVSEIYLFATLEADTFVDITDTVELKIQALQCHRSQLPPESVEARVRDWAAELGRKYGAAFAEEYRRIILR